MQFTIHAKTNKPNFYPSPTHMPLSNIYILPNKHK